MVFIDTSALYAVLDADDLNHVQAKNTWRRLLESREKLLTTNYVLIETFALVQRRLGMKAVRTLDKDVLPVIDVFWVGESVHKSSVSNLLKTGHRRLSLVDHISFTVMRSMEISTAFTFDSHFVEQGFHSIP